MYYTIPVLLIAILGNMSKFLHAFNASFYNIVIIVLIVVLVIVVIYKKRKNSMAECNVYDVPTFINKMYGEEQYTKTEDPDEELYEQM